MNKLDKAYQQLLQDIIDYGVEKQDRTGTGTKSIFGYTIRHNMQDGFPLLTTKKMAWKSIVTELLWFLKGDTNIKYLVDNDCHIWDGDAYKNYWEYNKLQSNPKWLKPVTYLNGNVGAELYNMEEFINKIKTDDEFASKWGELGPIYGKQWRSWNHPTNEFEGYDGIDQITNLINDLKTNPDSRRLMVNAWNIGELDQMVLPPCHYGFQVYTRELSYNERFNIYCVENDKRRDGLGYWNRETKLDVTILDELNVPKRAISLMWNQRSVDTFLGLPFNIASYGLLLEIIAKEVNMVPDQLIGSLGDVHLYSNHIEQAKEQIGRKLTYEERVELLKQAMGEEFEKTFEQPIPPLSETKSYFPKYKIHPALHTREPFPLPTLRINTEFWKTESGECGVGPLNTNLQGFESDDFTLENYQSHPAIKAPLSN